MIHLKHFTLDMRPYRCRGPKVFRSTAAHFEPMYISNYRWWSNEI